MCYFFACESGNTQVLNRGSATATGGIDALVFLPTAAPATSSTATTLPTAPVALDESKLPRRGAVLQRKVNELVDNSLEKSLAPWTLGLPSQMRASMWISRPSNWQENPEFSCYLSLMMFQLVSFQGICCFL